MSTKNYTSIRLSTAIYNDLKERRQQTGISVIAFVEKAVAEKIKRIKSKKKI